MAGRIVSAFVAAFLLPRSFSSSHSHILIVIVRGVQDVPKKSDLLKLLRFQRFKVTFLGTPCVTMQ